MKRKKYKLTPVSDKDLAVLGDASLPVNMQAEDLRKWVEHKIEALSRANQVSNALYKFRDENDGRLPAAGEEKAAFDSWAESVLTAGGFDPFDPFGGAEVTETEEMQTLPDGVTEDDITTTMEVHGMTRQEVLDRLNGVE